MKNFRFLIVVLFLSVNAFAQLSNTFYHQNGLKLTYTLKQINSDKESLDKYEVYLKVENSNNYKIYLNIGENYLRFQSNNIYNLSENYGGTSFNIGNDLYYSCNGNVASCLVNENETYEKNIFPMNFYVVKGKTPVLIDWKLNSWYEIKLDSCKNDIQNSTNINSSSNNQNSSTNTLLNLIKQTQIIPSEESYNDSLISFKKIFENSGYKVLRQNIIDTEEEQEANLYFENFVFSFWKDGVHNGFNIDFNTKDQLDYFKKLNSNSINKVEFPESWADKNRLLYFE